MIDKEAGIGKNISNIAKSAKKRFSDTFLKKKDRGLSEAKLHNEDLLMKAQSNNSKANSVTGRISGFIKGKDKARFEPEVNKHLQKQKNLDKRQSNLDSENSKRLRNSVAGVATTAVAAGTGANYINKTRKERQAMKDLRNERRRTARAFASQRMQKIAEEVDKEASTALSRRIGKLITGKNADPDKATRMMSKVLNRNKKVGQVSISNKDASAMAHGYGVNGMKGGTRSSNYAGTTSSGQVAKKLINSKGKGTTYIDSKGNRQTITPDAHRTANKIKPGVIGKQNNGYKSMLQKAKTRKIELNPTLPKNTNTPVNNTSSAPNSPIAVAMKLKNKLTKENT